jgi:hypothetical protein
LTTDPDSILWYLRRLSDDVTTIKEAQSILSQRMTSLDMRIHGLETAVLGVRGDIGTVHQRVDDLDRCLERIERRTGLIEQE